MHFPEGLENTPFNNDLAKVVDQTNFIGRASQACGQK